MIPTAQHIALVCAILAFACSVCAAVALRGRASPTLMPKPHRTFVRSVHVAALLLGVVTAIIQSVVLMMRMIYVAVDLMNGYPVRGARDYGFGSAGLWSIGCLFAACAITFLSTGDRRLGTCQLCCAAMMASWASLLAPVLRSTPTGGYQRTGTTLVLLAALAVLLALAVKITRSVQRRRGRIMPSGSGDSAAVARPWPGLSLSAAVISLVVILLVCYHLTVPIAVGPGGFRLTVLIATASGALAALAGFVLLSQEWSAHVAAAAMGLTSLALCGLATMAVPSYPVTLAEHYPLVFNAMIVGFAVATGSWTYLASVWERQPEGDQVRTTTGRLIPHAKRFAFYSAALALIVGAVMAIWPRLPAIAATDDTHGRVAAGLSANLFLLLVMLWCSRRLHKLAFHVLTVLTVLSTAGFLLARMRPFTPGFG